MIHVDSIESIDQQNKSYSEVNCKYLDINKVKAGVRSYGVLFNNGSGYNVPINDSTSTIFSASLWLGGLDQNGELHLSAERFNQIGYNYLPGPLYEDDQYGNCDSSITEYFDRVWKIDRQDISGFYSLIEDFKNNPFFDSDNFLTNKATRLQHFFERHANKKGKRSENIAKHPFDGNAFVT